MMEAKIYKCFIASPNDTQAERDLCDVVFDDINENLGQALGFRVESVKWDKDARPSFGVDRQSVITEQLLNNYQLFIGIFWNRLGSPTKRADSGTVEEFQIAYDKLQKSADVEIMLYFNQEPAVISTLDLEQVKKVDDFKSKVVELGALPWDYSGAEEFESELKKHLNNYFTELLSPTSVGGENSKPIKDKALKESVALILKSRLSDALCLFSNHPTVWVEPIVSDTNSISRSPDENYDNRIDLTEFVQNPYSVFINAPAQFGLTCLGLHLCELAWGKSKLWINIDAKKVRRDEIEKYVEREKRGLNLDGIGIDCIILDSWNPQLVGAKKLLRNLCNSYRDVPIVVLQSIDDTQFTNEEENVKVSRSFTSLHLLALPRRQIRSVVSQYNDEKNIGEDDAILDKVVSDLDVLNIHRTPQNCFTLLKVAEKNFDISPVNRTKMIEMVLFVIFDFNEFPDYSIQPDVKDCEYVLGCFCEQLIRGNSHEFTRDGFLKELDRYCAERLLKLEVSLVFDTLFKNNIIIKYGETFSFKPTYWIYYFAAARMFVNEEFCSYIIEQRPYPEIIEFYTGIDRNRGDILEILEHNLAETCSLVETKTGLPEDLNPLKDASWNPSEETVNKMKKEVGEDVIASKLPDTVKDKYADIRYDQRQPYNQSIRSIFSEYSMLTLKYQLKASSRALRNSDYVDPEVKRKLLDQISRGWRIWSKVIFAISPLLAAEGRAAFEGQGFVLVGDFGKTKEKRLNAIFLANSYNVIGEFQDDLYSPKIGLLLNSAIEDESNHLTVHLLMLLITARRPPEWRKYVEKYIDSLHFNSFYLYEILSSLRISYEFDFCTESESREIAFLIKKCLAKHKFDDPTPSLNTINKISNKNLPKREGPSSK